MRNKIKLKLENLSCLIEIILTDVNEIADKWKALGLWLVFDCGEMSLTPIIWRALNLFAEVIGDTAFNLLYLVSFGE